MSDRISIGAKVTGTYLGHAISGTVKNVESPDTPGHKRYHIMLEEPIDVSKSEHMEVLRRSIFMTTDVDGYSVNHKGIRDDIAFVEAAD